MSESEAGQGSMAKVEGQEMTHDPGMDHFAQASEPTDNQEIEAAELAIREPTVPKAGEVWGDPRNPETWRHIERVSPNVVSYVTFAKGELWASEQRKDFDGWFAHTKPWNIRGMVEDYLQRADNRGVAWWMQVAEAKQEERDRERQRAEQAEEILRRWKYAIEGCAAMPMSDTLAYFEGK